MSRVVRPRLAAMALAATALLLPVGSPAQAAGSLPLDLTTVLTHECMAPGNVVVDANCAEDRPSSWVEEKMPAPGPIAVGGIDFLWPQKGLQTKDTVMAFGQELAVPKNVTGWRSLAMLAAMRGAGGGGRLTIRYTDGSKQDLAYAVPGWTAKGEERAKANYVPGVAKQYGADAVSTVVFGDEGAIGLAVMPIEAKKTVKSLTLTSPGGVPLMIYGLAFSNVTKAPPPPK